LLGRAAEIGFVRPKLRDSSRVETSKLRKSEVESPTQACRVWGGPSGGLSPALREFAVGLATISGREARPSRFIGSAGEGPGFHEFGIYLGELRGLKGNAGQGHPRADFRASANSFIC